jgi:hypothetical protein
MCCQRCVDGRSTGRGRAGVPPVAGVGPVRAVSSPEVRTPVDGRFALRACITNFRTTRADVERVLTVVRELAV